MRLRNVVPAAASAIALILSATAASAGGTLTAVAPASVTVLAPVTFQATQGLNFGAVTRPSNSGSNTITLDATSSNVTLTGAGDGARAAGSVSVAKFSVMGPAGITYTTTQSLVFAQPGLTKVSASLPVPASGALGVIPASGVQELRLGGAFELSAGTPAQAYTGSLTVTVSYN
jgi:hypothetical protein